MIQVDPLIRTENVPLIVPINIFNWNNLEEYIRFQLETLPI